VTVGVAGECRVGPSERHGSPVQIGPEDPADGIPFAMARVTFPEPQQMSIANGCCRFAALELFGGVPGQQFGLAPGYEGRRRCHQHHPEKVLAPGEIRERNAGKPPADQSPELDRCPVVQRWEIEGPRLTKAQGLAGRLEPEGPQRPLCTLVRLVREASR
jgi:hypothetical protein